MCVMILTFTSAERIIFLCWENTVSYRWPLPVGSICKKCNFNQMENFFMFSDEW